MSVLLSRSPRVAQLWIEEVMIILTFDVNSNHMHTPLWTTAYRTGRPWPSYQPVPGRETPHLVELDQMVTMLDGILHPRDGGIMY